MFDEDDLIANRAAPSIPGLIWQVRRSLKLLPQISHIGISKVILRNRSLLDMSDPDSRPTTFGYYIFATSDTSASIELYLEPIYHDIPKFLWWSTVPTILIVRTIAHEVGHHLHLGIGNLGSPRDDPEVIAKKYSTEILESLKRNWKYRLGFWWIKEIAFWHYVQGMLDDRRKKYKSAAEHFYTAWNLDPKLGNVASYYWSTKEKSTTTEVST